MYSSVQCKSINIFAAISMDVTSREVLCYKQGVLFHYAYTQSPPDEFKPWGSKACSPRHMTCVWGPSEMSEVKPGHAGLHEFHSVTQ